MNSVKMLNKIKSIFNSFGETNLKLDLDKNVLIVPIESEDEMIDYNLALQIVNEEMVLMHTAFKLNKDYKNNLKLISECNSFNEQSFLKFVVKDDYLKISYLIPEIEEDDCEKIIRIFTIIPNVIYQFYPDIKKYLINGKH